jgi:hypothetical protein
MTKAQEKRNRQFRESLTRRLTAMFNPFRNYNYSSYVSSKIAPIQMILDSKWNGYKDLDEAFNDNRGVSYSELGLVNRIYLQRYDISEREIRQKEANMLAVTKDSLYPKMKSVMNARSVISLIEIHKLQWLSEVKEAFDNRFESMITSMCKMKPKQDNFTIEVEELSNSWEEFSVLIHVEDTTFHARAIWVNCTDKISHYRFITTTRKRK